MKINWNKAFSISVAEEEYFKDKNDKIEYTGCKLSGEHCLRYLPQINNYFRESEQFFRVKDFNRAINSLEYAYNVAEEIQGPECQKCVMFFKATVIQSLESVHSELEKMTKGIFSTKRYQPSCLKAEGLLMRLKSNKEVKPDFSTSRKGQTLQPVYMF